MSLIKWQLDISKGGIGVGNFNISTEQLDNMFWISIRIVLIIIGMIIVIKIGSKIIDKTVKNQSRSNLKFTLDEKKAKTLGAVLKSILKYMVYFFGIGAILTEVFGTISLTFASIGGVAIGFGAQSLIKDVINGFFILFEDQFAVGDYVTIESKSGIVESIELRVTKFRDFNGDLHIIPNGAISKVTNHSRGNMRFMVEIKVPHKENIDKIIEVLNIACESFGISDENIVERVKVIGVTQLNDLGFVIRVAGKAKAMTQWDCENQLRVHLKKALDKEDIVLVQPSTTNIIKIMDRKE